MEFQNKLIAAAKAFELTVTPEQAAQFAAYADELTEWNKVMNLTAITDPDEMIVKHFLDSLLLFRACSLPENASLIDVGTGAGFPGLPAKIYRPDLRVTLLDSLHKRLNFLEAVCGKTGVEAKRVHARAEDAGREPALRESYDAACARAVAALPVLCEYCLPFVRVGRPLYRHERPGPRGRTPSRRAAPSKRWAESWNRPPPLPCRTAANAALQLSEKPRPRRKPIPARRLKSKNHL